MYCIPTVANCKPHFLLLSAKMSQEVMELIGPTIMRNRARLNITNSIVFCVLRVVKMKNTLH